LVISPLPVAGHKTAIGRAQLTPHAMGVPVDVPQEAESVDAPQAFWGKLPPRSIKNSTPLAEYRRKNGLVGVSKLNKPDIEKIVLWFGICPNPQEKPRDELVAMIRAWDEKQQAEIARQWGQKLQSTRSLANSQAAASGLAKSQAGAPEAPAGSTSGPGVSSPDDKTQGVIQALRHLSHLPASQWQQVFAAVGDHVPTCAPNELWFVMAVLTWASQLAQNNTCANDDDDEDPEVSC
jgi:hypothetical protein